MRRGEVPPRAGLEFILRGEDAPFIFLVFPVGGRGFVQGVEEEFGCDKNSGM